jgi:hypothetical protein
LTPSHAVVIALLISVGNTNVRSPAPIWGSPNIEDDFKLWVNSGYLFGGGQQLYALGNYVSKKVTGGFYYRNPNTRGGVFSSDGGPWTWRRPTPGTSASRSLWEAKRLQPLP